LEALGITLTEEQEKAISTEAPKHVVPKDQYNTKVTELKTATDTVKDRDKQLEDLKKVDAEGLQKKIDELQEANKTAAEKHEAELKQIKLDNALEKALLGAKAKNPLTVKPLLQLDAVELLEDGTLKGLDEQLKKLTEADDTKFLFNTETNQKQQPKGFVPAEKKDSTPGDGTPATLADAVRMSLES